MSKYTLTIFSKDKDSLTKYLNFFFSYVLFSFFIKFFLSFVLNFCQSIQNSSTFKNFEPIYSIVQGMKLVTLRFLKGANITEMQYYKGFISYYVNSGIIFMNLTFMTVVLCSIFSLIISTYFLTAESMHFFP